MILIYNIQISENYGKEIYNYPIEMPKQESFSKVAERMEEVIKNIASVNEGNTVC